MNKKVTWTSFHNLTKVVRLIDKATTGQNTFQMYILTFTFKKCSFKIDNNQMLNGSLIVNDLTESDKRLSFSFFITLFLFSVLCGSRWVFPEFTLLHNYCHLLISRSNFEKLCLTKECQQTSFKKKINSGGISKSPILNLKNQKVARL